jgi:hypothetical protein
LQVPAAQAYSGGPAAKFSVEPHSVGSERRFEAPPGVKGFRLLPSLGGVLLVVPSGSVRPSLCPRFPPRPARCKHDRIRSVHDREVVMKVVHCPCGTDVEGATDDTLVENVEAHIAADHPEMVGNYSREQILGMAEES